MWVDNVRAESACDTVPLIVQTMAQMQLSEAYKRDLLGQIQAHREATIAERQSYLEEGKRIRQEQMREKATLETVSTCHIYCFKLARSLSWQGAQLPIQLIWRWNSGDPRTVLCSGLPTLLPWHGIAR